MFFGSTMTFERPRLRKAFVGYFHRREVDGLEVPGDDEKTRAAAGCNFRLVRLQRERRLFDDSFPRRDKFAGRSGGEELVTVPVVAEHGVDGIGVRFKLDEEKDLNHVHCEL